MSRKRSKKLRNADELKAAVGNWATKIKARPKQIRIQRMARKWASCSSEGRITFNSQLFSQPYRFQRFVIVHELVHLKVPNHGKLFKALLSAYLPEWRRVTRRSSVAPYRPYADDVFMSSSSPVRSLSGKTLESRRQ
ncbi:MAG: M48 metallopeptidase family protein [Candidatus Udaeobacter sp.]